MRVDEYTDYHMHTYYSDGICSPEQVVKTAREHGLEVISITDHDGVRGIAEALEAGRKYGVEVVPGIEFSTEFEGAGVHMLGYFIDTSNEALLNKCEWILARREERNNRFIRQLNADGYRITEQDIREGRQCAFIGKPVIAGALVRLGYFDDEKTVFDRIFDTPEYQNIKKRKINAEEAMELISGAGGIPVIAHPALIEDIGKRGSDEYNARAEEIIGKLAALGLRGIESDYIDFTDEERKRYSELGERYWLIRTRGSDYHGRGRHSRMFEAPRPR
jgi:predicted metal-dependent phosphoesterase TrpH